MELNRIRQAINCYLFSVIDPHRDGDWSGATDVNASLERLLSSVLRGAFQDMRSFKDTKRLFNPDGSINYEELQKLTPERRGEFLSAAGFVVGYVPVTNIIPREVVKLSRKVINAEKRSPYYLELFAAAVAGESWRSEEMEGDAGRQKCIRCGKNASWLTVLNTPDRMPPELTWRMSRPENYIPICGMCRQKLLRGDDDGGVKVRSRKIDLAWALWGNRFEAYWNWYRAYENNNLPRDWDVIEYPLWPKEYGGDTWETGSGHVLDCAPRGPRGILRSKIHRDALMRGLNESQRYIPIYICASATRSPSRGFSAAFAAG
jgi:hypothetical protein